jgi:glycosyltransferase involved in cell wall biosynthesis
MNRGGALVQGKYEGSVVIPAHNEERVIRRCLEALTNGTGKPAVASPLEIVVVCNGCTDLTAVVASQFPQVTVIEIPESSKVAALNTGDGVVTAWPRIYLDADSELSNASARSLLREAVHHKEPTIVTASVEFETGGCSILARSYVRGSKRTSFVRFGVNAGGVYALNGSGRARFEKFPELTNDDFWVSSLFDTHEQVIDPSARVITRPPRDVRSLIRVRSRIYYGNREVEASGPRSRPPWRGWRNVAYAIRRTRSLGEAGDLVVYIAINIIAKRKALKMARAGSPPAWQRDDSSRL